MVIDEEPVEFDYGTPVKGYRYKIQKEKEEGSNEIKIDIPYGPGFDLIKNLKVNLYFDNGPTPLLNPSINTTLEVGGVRSNIFNHNEVWFQETGFPRCALSFQVVSVVIDVSEYANSNVSAEICFDNYILDTDIHENLIHAGTTILFNGQSLSILGGMSGWIVN